MSSQTSPPPFSRDLSGDLLAIPANRIPGHAFVPPGPVAPDLPPADQCAESGCGQPEAEHQGSALAAAFWDRWADALAAAGGPLLQPVPPEQDDDDPGNSLEPYCSTCGEWIGRFVGLDDWQHFRGDGAPGGQRDLYDAGHPAEVAWIVPAGRTLSPASLAVLRSALADAIEYRRPSGSCSDCDAHPAGLCEPHADDLDQADLFAALAKQLGAELDQ